MKDEDFAGLISALESNGRSRTEIAQAVGVSRVTVWRIANGLARNPAYRTISRLKELEQKNRRAVLPVKQKAL